MVITIIILSILIVLIIAFAIIGIKTSYKVGFRRGYDFNNQIKKDLFDNINSKKVVNDNNDK